MTRCSYQEKSQWDDSLFECCQRYAEVDLFYCLFFGANLSLLLIFIILSNCDIWINKVVISAFVDSLTKYHDDSQCAFKTNNTNSQYSMRNIQEAPSVE